MYVWAVVVVSTKNPKPEAMADGTPVIVTVLPDPAPFAIVTVVPLGVKVVDAALTDTIVPAPLLTSGLAVGKLVSFAIATKPPTSSTKSIIRASIAAVVAKPDEKWGEVPCAFIESIKDKPVTEKELIDFCTETLAKFKVPKKIEFCELPKTSTGKIQKFELRKKAKEIN